jgi:hypothetical protein
MTRLLHGSVVLALCAALMSCGDPTADLRGGPSRIVADPSALFLAQGETKNVTVRVLDDQGNELSEPVSITSFAPTLVTVSIDSGFLPGTDTTTAGQIPDPTRTRLIVTGVGRDSGSVVLSAGGVLDTLPVRVLPVATEFDATFSNQTPALGETVTVTAPAGFSFAADSGLTFAAGPTPIVVARAADGSSLTFLPGPNTVGKATFQGVVPSYAPALILPFTTNDTIATPVVDTLDATFSSTTPAQNQYVVLTPPAGFHFTDSAAVSMAGTSLPIFSRGASGSSITFLPAPGSFGVVKVDSVLVDVVPQFPLSLPVRDTIVVGPLAAVAGTGSTATAPAITLAAPGGTAGFFDAATFTAPDITFDGGVAAQYYKFTPTTTAVTITMDVQGPGADTDVDIVLCSDAACSDGGDFTAAATGQPETGTFTVTAGTTYYIAVVLFLGTPPGATGISLTISQ